MEHCLDAGPSLARIHAAETGEPCAYSQEMCCSAGRDQCHQPAQASSARKVIPLSSCSYIKSITLPQTMWPLNMWSLFLTVQTWKMHCNLI